MLAKGSFLFEPGFPGGSTNKSMLCKSAFDHARRFRHAR
jgi:hypothetical protein